MELSICPRVKRAERHAGEFRFSVLKLFTVGDGSAFGKFFSVLLPELSVEEVSRDGANAVLSVSRVFSARDEYCIIRIRECGIEITCRDSLGARNAAAILFQLIGREGEDFSLPCGLIEDYPDTDYRAMMLESSGRSWIPMKRIYRHIEEMAIARMNVLQFHFMEGPGCTVALDSYPTLHGYGPENLKYSKDEVRAMITYAERLGITVCPFVEVISHAVEFNFAADIGCPGDAPPHMFAVCVGQEKTYDAIERVLREVAELFPSDVIHIGADEYDMSAVTPKTVYWDRCPHCRALSERMGYTTFRELFLYAIDRVNRIVNGLGRIAMMWNADVKPGEIPDGMSRNIVMHFYRCDNVLGAEKHYGLTPDGYVEDGFAVLNSYYPETYMDLPGYMKAERLNAWTPLSLPRVSVRNRARIIGGCCCAWDDFRHFERTVSPAIFLFADRLWNADGDPVPYDDAYGCMMTHALFRGALPRGLNVFRAVGDVLPPLKDEALVHEKRIEAPLSELTEIKAALDVPADKGDELAIVYREMVEAAIVYRESDPNERRVLDRSVKFEG